MSKQKRKLAVSKKDAVKEVKANHVKSPAQPVVSKTKPSKIVEPEESDEESDEEEQPPPKPFRFFDLPAELRLRIYHMILSMDDVIDLNPMNYRLIAPRLNLLLVSQRMFEETYRLFYRQCMRLYPTHGRFFHTKKPLLTRLPPRYRKEIVTMELRLGPGWTSPPRGQKTNPELGLADCTSLRRLRIFVECDPSEPFFSGFRGKNATEDTYKLFCLDILQGIFSQVPSIRAVEIDAYPGVKKDAPLVMALRRRIEEHGKKLEWGPLRGWEKENDEPGLVGLENLLAGMNISDHSRLIVAEA